MNTQEIKDYLSTCSIDECRDINRHAYRRLKAQRDTIKYSFGPGDRVTSDDSRWHYGTATVVRRLKKNILVRTDSGSELRVGPGLLRKLEMLSN